MLIEEVRFSAAGLEGSDSGSSVIDIVEMLNSETVNKTDAQKSSYNLLTRIKLFIRGG